MLIKNNTGIYKVIKESDNKVYRLTLNHKENIVKYIPIKSDS